MGAKTEDRPYMGMGALSGGDVAPATTIVGGQPEQAPRAPRQRIPVGLERVLCAAAADRGFARELLSDREAALASGGFELTSSERAVLATLPAGQLAAMIGRIDVSEENLARRGFMRSVAGTVVALAAGTALGACSGPRADAPEQSGAPFLGPSEIATDASVPPEPQPPYVEPGPPAGIRPDLPPPPAPEPSIGIGGIQPGAPPPPTLDVDPPPPPATRGVRPD